MLLERAVLLLVLHVLSPLIEHLYLNGAVGIVVDPGPFPLSVHHVALDLLLPIGIVPGHGAFGLAVLVTGLHLQLPVRVELLEAPLQAAILVVLPFHHRAIRIVGRPITVFRAQVEVLHPPEPALRVEVVPGAVLPLTVVTPFGHQPAVRVEMAGMRGIAVGIVVHDALQLPIGGIVVETPDRPVVLELSGVAHLVALVPQAHPRTLFAALIVHHVRGAGIGARLAHGHGPAQGSA